jgi:general secretion pathway protein H
MTPQRGFTLIELVVVLFLLAIATGLALPAVGRALGSLELRAQAAGISAFLRYGREQAITRRAAHEVRVEPEARRLTLIPVGAERPKAQKQLSARVRISVEPPAPVITFSPQGFSSGASLRLEGEGGRVHRISVDPITGRVSTRRGDS